MKEKSTTEASLFNLLSINGGSSGIKFALYRENGSLGRLLYGNIDRIGLPDSRLTYVISTDTGKVVVRVIHTNEEWMIARTVSQMINLS